MLLIPLANTHLLEAQPPISPPWARASSETSFGDKLLCQANMVIGVVPGQRGYSCPPDLLLHPSCRSLDAMPSRSILAYYCYESHIRSSKADERHSLTPIKRPRCLVRVKPGILSIMTFMVLRPYQPTHPHDPQPVQLLLGPHYGRNPVRAPPC